MSTTVFVKQIRKIQIKIVFTQIGNPIPKYLWANLNRIQNQKPENELVLITDKESDSKKCKSLGIEHYYFKNLTTNLQYFANQQFDKDFRNGFWYLTSVRLFALCEYVEKNRVEPILHLESDMLTLPNFPFDEIKKSTYLQWCSFNSERDVASIVYIPNQDQASWFRNELMSYFIKHQSGTDMTALRYISELHENRVRYFPILPSEDSKWFKTDCSSGRKLALTEKYSDYKGIFDSATLGMWFLGQDPRNHKGMLKRHVFMPESDIDPRGMKLELAKRELRIKISQEPIFCLHVHSKSRLLLGSHWNFFLRSLIVLDNLGIAKNYFMPRVFVTLIVKKVARVYQKMQTRLKEI